MVLTGDEGPQVKSHGALQRLIGSAEGVEEEEASGHAGEECHNTTEEDDGDVEARGDGAQEVREDWKTARDRPAVRGVSAASTEGAEPRDTQPALPVRGSNSRRRHADTQQTRPTQEVTNRESTECQRDRSL